MIDMSPELITALMFVGLLIGLFMGHPLAFVLGGLAVIFGYIGWGPSIFYVFMNRIGASVVTMGLLAVPMMRKYNYSEELTYGSICAGGTLGILIPPSIMLVVMASQATLSVGKLFAGAVFPGVILSVLYMGYIAIKCYLNPELGPPISREERGEVTNTQLALMVLKSLIPPVILISGVLGSIFFGIATPTEASGVGAFLSFIMVIAYGKFTWQELYQAVIQTSKITTMVIMILCGATCFTGVFLGVGGGDVVTNFIMGLGWGKWGTFWVMMAIVFFLGMFIDWIGIVLICFPLFLPIAKQFGFDPIWFVVMMAINLQASFLTPPFGYALFYIKGVDPVGIDIRKVYRGIVPFVILMLIGLLICTSFPDAIMWLPNLVVS